MYNLDPLRAGLGVPIDEFLRRHPSRRSSLASVPRSKPPCAMARPSAVEYRLVRRRRRRCAGSSPPAARGSVPMARRRACPASSSTSPSSAGFPKRWPKANCASAPWPTPCRKWSGRRCPMASTTTTTPAGTSSPACRRARPTAKAGTACSTPTIRNAPGRSGATRSKPASPTRSNTACGTTAATIAGRWAGRLPIRDAGGQIVRWFGTCTDIHETKLAAEERELVAQELSHRIKNIFAVLTGIISLSARSRPEVKAFADELRQRIYALGEAHDFVRPHSHISRPPENQGSLQVAHRAPDAALSRGRRRSASRSTATMPRSTTAPPRRWPCCSTNWAPTPPSMARCRPPGAGWSITGRPDGERYHLTWKEHGGPVDRRRCRTERLRLAADRPQRRRAVARHAWSGSGSRTACGSRSTCRSTRCGVRRGWPELASWPPARSAARTAAAGQGASPRRPRAAPPHRPAAARRSRSVTGLGSTPTVPGTPSPSWDGLAVMNSTVTPCACARIWPMRIPVGPSCRLRSTSATSASAASASADALVRRNADRRRGPSPRSHVRFR